MLAEEKHILVGRGEEGEKVTQCWQKKNITIGERGGGQKGDALLAEEKHITRGEDVGKVTHCWQKKNTLLEGRRAER